MAEQGQGVTVKSQVKHYLGVQEKGTREESLYLTFWKDTIRR